MILMTNLIFFSPKLQSLLEESSRYHVPRLSGPWNSGETSDVENVRPLPPRESTLMTGKGKSNQIRTAKKAGDKVTSLLTIDNFLGGMINLHAFQEHFQSDIATLVGFPTLR